MSKGVLDLIENGEQMELPLKGIKVLESAHQYPGPYCTMLLADLGAEVLKLEKPGFGDQVRKWPHFFNSINRNKESLTLNLKTPGAKEILYRLVERYDVFTEGFRPGVSNRLGMDFNTLREINPKLIYCSISGYGQDGPYRDLPGHDLNYQALSGMLQFFKDNKGDFVQPGLDIADLSSAMFAVIGIMAALFAREKTGKGQYIDVSMLNGLLSWLSPHFGTFFGTGLSEKVFDPGYGIFWGEDGKPFALGIAHEDWFWDRLCSAVGLEEFIGIKGSERMVRRKELSDKLQHVFGQKPMHEWLKALRKVDVPVSVVQDLEKVVEDPHVNYRNMIHEIRLSSGERIKQIRFPVKFSHMQDHVRIPPPTLGEHNEEILVSLAYSREQIERFKNEGVV